MLRRHKPRVFERWLEGYVGGPGLRSSPDPEKVRVAQLLGKALFCPKEKAMVSWIDVACFAWKPRECTP